MREWIKNESIFGKVKDMMDLSGEKKEKVLIIGIETGDLARYIERDVKEVHGIDRDPEALDHYPNVKIDKSRAFPYGDNEFDLAIFNNSLHSYLGDTTKAIEETWRVLRSKGKIIVWEDIPMAPKIFSNYAEFVCSFENRIVFNKEDIQKLFLRFEGSSVKELVLRQQNVNKIIGQLDEKDKRTAIERLLGSSPAFKHNVGFYVDPYIDDDINFDMKIVIGAAMKNTKEGMYNWGWWDGPDRYHNVNRNIIGQCQRKTFFKVVTKLAPGPIGVDIGGPGLDEHGVKVYGFNIVPAARHIVGDGSELPFKDNSIDFFLSSHTIEHIKDVPKAMREWIRALKPGGLIAFTMPDIRNFLHSNDSNIADPDLAPSEMTSLQMREILESIPEAEILLFDTQNNNFDFDGLIRKRSI